MSSVEIQASNGKTIHGTLQKENRKEPLVVVCHGYKTSSEHPAAVAIVAGLNNQSHTTFTFDFSEGSELDLEQQVDDIQSVVNYFKDYDEVVVLAPSFAALTMSMAIPKIPKVKGLVTVNGFFGSGKLGSIYSKSYKVFKLLRYLSPSHKKLWKTYKDNFKPQNIHVPVLVIHSKTDEIVSYEQSVDFYEALTGQKELKLLSDIEHHLTTEDAREQITNLIDVWVKKLD